MKQRAFLAPTIGLTLVLWLLAGCGTPQPQPTPTGSAPTPVSVAVPSAPPAPSVPLLFVSDRSGSAEIYAIEGDGSGLAQLTTDGSFHSSPAWSPDHSRIAFISNRDGQGEIYVMEAGGSHVQRLTHGEGTCTSVAWSPDGSHLVFTRMVESQIDVYVIGSDGEGELQVSRERPGTAWSPTWSADGKQIAFIAGAAPDYDIYVVGADGTGLVDLTGDPAPDYLPAWSPASLPSSAIGGGRIAFVSFRDQGVAIYVMEADGSGPVRLTDGGSDSYPVWSPDGSQIAFVSTRTGSNAVYVMPAPGSQAEGNAGGLEAVQVSDEPVEYVAPVWSPDGRQIAFTATRDGNMDIYVVDVGDIGGQHNVTDNPGQDQSPSW